MLFFVYLFLTFFALVVEGEFESFPAPDLKEISWINFRPCAKQLHISWLYPEGVGGLRRFFVKNTFYVWSEDENKGAWREESLLVQSTKRSLILKNSRLGTANKLSICSESIGGRVMCSRTVYMKVPAKQFGTTQSPSRCMESIFSVPPDLTSVRIIDVQFPDLEAEVVGGVTVKWAYKGDTEFTRGFVVKIRSLETGEWKENSKKVSLETNKFVIQGLNYSMAHFISVCGDEKRENSPEICSKQVEVQFRDPSPQSGYIGTILSPLAEPKMVPINTFGAYTTESKIVINWRYPFMSQGSEFEAGIFSNCPYPSALRNEKRVRVSSSETRAEVVVSGGMKPLCARVCVVSSSRVESGRCGMLVPIKEEVVTPPRLMSNSSFVRVSLQSSQTRESSTFLVLSVEQGQLETGGRLSVTCWGRHEYKGRLGGRMVRRVVQMYSHEIKSVRENSLKLEGLLTDMEYKCALDGQIGDKIILSTNDAVFKTVAGRPTPPPPPQVQGDTHMTDRGTVTSSFSLFIIPSSEREGVPEFYDLVALPLAMYTDQFGRVMYKPEFSANTIMPQYRDPLGKVPSSVHHQLIAKRTNSPVPFQVYRLDHLILPLNITFDTPLDTSLWKQGIKYCFLLIAYSYSGINGSLVFSRSEVSLPISIARRHGGTSIESVLETSDPMGVVGEYMDKAFDMTIGQLPEEHHLWVGTLGALLGYILAALLGIALMLVTVLYIRLKLAVRKGFIKLKKKPVPKEKGEVTLVPLRGGEIQQSDEESFYYENTTFLRDITTASESESAGNSPNLTPLHRHTSPLIQPLSPMGHIHTLSPGAHQLSQSRHPPPSATQLDTATQLTQ